MDQARLVVAEAFCPHRLTALDAGRGFETRFHAVGAGGVSLCFLDYGGRVHIAPEAQESFYLVLVPLAGSAEVRCGRREERYGFGGASIPPVDRGYTLRVQERSPHLVVRIARERLEGHLRALTARPVVEPVRFDLRMDTATGGGRSWRRAVDLLREEADSDGLVPAHPLAVREVERLVLTQLLLAQPHNYTGLLHQERPGAEPRVVRRAAELIEAHAAEPLTVEDIAEACGVSVRTLQEGFRRFRDTTPTGHLREVRLRRVREELAGADPTRVTVTEVAARWGFSHHGRFSARYRECFGEPPSATLRR